MPTEQIDELSQASLDDEFVLGLPLPNRIFGFHAQQAVEKLLKMLILASGQLHDFTHDITRLRATAESLGEAMPVLPFRIADLTDYAVEFRYTTPPDLDDADRDQIRETVRILREYVQTRLVALKA